MAKLWKNMCESLCLNMWIKLEKFCTTNAVWQFYTFWRQFPHRIWDFVESFPGGFAQYFISVKWVVLHIFHMAYYYNY